MPSSFFFLVLFDRRIMSSSSPLHFLVGTLPVRTFIGNFCFLRSVFNLDLVLGPEDRSGRYGWPSGFVLLCTDTKNNIGGAYPAFGYTYAEYTSTAAAPKLEISA